ncbi:hypothetical protein C900_05392 [Fulvivirga imtechensis AK7]|uniref:DUF3164 family protein n=1 Tax=Fulvivirga imtechensis AK7 TaxID=1237149 RepID=L8JJW1_9BACT|nr:DUF3164 family protein [Fulvivirga imtechensis]ELR69196.1 hypothetical protein C900_05392 [Fulvivirga imtechensis AK7]
MSTVELDKLTDDQLEQLLQERQKKKQREELARRKKYEQDREELIDTLIMAAQGLQVQLQQFKKAAFENMDQFSERMKEYGEVNANSKGGFSIENAAGTLKIRYSSQTKKGFDERADMAEQKLKSFLERFVKVRNKETYKLVTQLLERTNSGEFDDKLIMKLWNMENDFDDADWKDAIRLFKESYNPKATTKYMNFYKRDDHGNWKLINLNFASVNI